jgi:hypothetical protein
MLLRAAKPLMSTDSRSKQIAQKLNPKVVSLGKLLASKEISP